MHPPMYPPNYEVISKTDWRDTTNLLYGDRSILWACHALLGREVAKTESNGAKTEVYC